ncbi:hypothetical protein G7Y89_g13681 [Cudoniella acicularis]|uniref:Uncharacterized protein n=1 Tax=Cudoniella acicularis TaxID=354080 RepID=A0A8H4R7S6_9HELO|nr:hypothetical protein G7Y89_g13681 [Cudoniella acicularis]
MNLFSLIRRGLDRLALKSIRDSSVVPAVCYDMCNNAYIEAQKVGMTPAACNTSSTYQEFYAECTQCIEANSIDTAISVSTYIDPLFGNFTAYCADITNSTSSPEQQSLIASQASQASYWSSILSQASSLGYLSSAPAGPVTTPVIISTFIVTQSAPNATILSAQTSAQPTNTSPPSTTSQSPNQAWIAGAVIGPLALFAAVGSAAFYIWKRKRKGMENGQEGEIDEKKDAVEKAQLHGDSIVPNELDGKKRAELEGERMSLMGGEGVVSELPALEAVGTELEGRRGATSPIKRKPLPSRTDAPYRDDDGAG